MSLSKRCLVVALSGFLVFVAASTLGPTPAAQAQPSCEATWSDFSTSTWQGTWSDTEGWLFGFVMTLSRQGHRVEGFIEWELQTAPMAEFASRIGQRAREYVSGAINLQDCTLALSGIRVTDPTLIATDQYSIDIAAGGAISGKTRGNERSWSASISGAQVP